MLAHNLLRLDHHLEQAPYRKLAAALLGQGQSLVVKGAQHLTNWVSLYAALLRPGAEAAISGPQAKRFQRELSQYFLPNDILADTLIFSSLLLLEGRNATATTTRYMCRHRACQLPVHPVGEALGQPALAAQ